MEFQLNSGNDPNTYYNIKPCIACLTMDVKLFGKQEMTPEIISAYMDLVKINNIGSTIEICFACMQMLNSINEFKINCLKSIEFLRKKIFIKIEESQDQISIDFNDFSNSSIKEEKVFAEELQVKSQETTIEKPKLPKKKSKNLGTKDIEPKTVIPNKETKNHRWSHIIKGYCHICCYDHRNSHKHAIEVHSKELENGSLRCLLCEEDFKGVDALLLHLESKHKKFDLPQKCLNCNMTTKVREEFIKHVICHYSKRNRLYYCEFCNSVFCTANKLKFHHRVHFGAIKCTRCCMSFFKKTDHEFHVEKHKKQYDSSMEYTCDFCGFVSKRKNSLLHHMLIKHHSTIEKAFKCQQCGNAYKTKSQLTEHISKRHQAKTICVLCGKSYKKRTYLKIHIQNEHTDGPKLKPKKPKTRNFACDQCDMKFFAANTLKKHKFSHSKTRPYQCHMCSTGYYMNEYLRKHYLREHGVVYTAKEIRKIIGKKSYDDSD